MRISDWSSDVCSSDLTGRRLAVDAELAVPARGVRPDDVEQGSPRHGGQPRRRIRRALVLPGGERPDERLLHRVLGRREVGSATDEDAQHVRDELAQLELVHSVQRLRPVLYGRTSWRERGGRDGVISGVAGKLKK